jgi:uncharacterized membrane protein
MAMQRVEQQLQEKRSFHISARTLSLIVLALAILVSGYLSYLKLTSTAAICVTDNAAFDCGTVLNSVYSELFGVPIAYIGFFTNILIVALLLLQDRVNFMRSFGTMLIFGVVLIPTLFSVYLIYVQAALIGKFCPWCLTHEALIFVVFGISLWRVAQEMREA